jgi:hypothetical protein
MNIADAVVEARKDDAVELTPRRLADIRQNGRGQLAQRNFRAIRYPIQALPASSFATTGSLSFQASFQARFVPFIVALPTPNHKFDQAVAIAAQKRLDVP